MNRYKNRMKTFAPVMLIMLSITILIIAPLFLSKADPSGANITATLYNTSDYTSGTALTEPGSTVTGWEVGTTKYLKIDPQVPSDGNTYKVVIELPQEFYAAISTITTPTGYQNVEFTQNESFTVNTNKTYPLNQYSGTFEYTLERNQTTATVQLAISYDDILWANLANSSLTPPGVKPINVKLVREETNGEDTVLKEISISQAISGSKRVFSQNTYVNTTSTTTATLKFSEKATLKGLIRHTNQNTYSFYYEKLDMTIKLPSYKDTNNVVHYLTPDLSTLKFPSFTTPQYTVDTSELATNGVIKATVNKSTFTSSTLVSIDTTLPDDLKNAGIDTMLFNNGRITIKGEAKNGMTDINFFDLAIENITYTNILEENVKASPFSSTPNIEGKPDDAVARFGGMTLRNEGKGDSGEKQISYVFDTGNTGKIKVTSINICSDTVQSAIDIEYSLVDDQGNKVYFDDDGNIVPEAESTRDAWHYSLSNTKYYNKTAASNMNILLVRSALQGEHKNYYFKTVKYNLKEIKAGIYLYASSGSNGTTSGGNFWGYISDNAVAGNVINSSIKIIDVNGDVSDISLTSKVTINAGQATSYYLGMATMDKTSVEAGNSVTVNGNIELTSYEYGNSTWLRDIVIGFVLPEGVSINERAITIKNSANQVIEDIRVLAPVDLNNGNYLWKIKLPEDVYISYFNESLGALPVGALLKYSVQLKTAITMNTTVLSTYDIIYVAGIDQKNVAAGSYGWAKKTDIYDLNENGSTTDNVAGIRDTQNRVCQIIPATATLDISDNISITSKGSILEEGDNNIYTSADTVTYSATIGCQSGGQVNDFEYYIPIPKSDSIKDDFLIRGESSNNFDFALQGAATLTGDAIFDIKYCLDSAMSYSKAKSSTNWYTAQEIENDPNLNWSDVTVLKVTMLNGIINNGEEATIAINMKYDGNTYEEETGKINKWSSGGTYDYLNNGRIASGDISAPGFDVMINSEVTEAEITLTAAKDRNPQETGNVNRVVINSGIPQYEKAHNFKITKVETYNVIMQTKTYIQNNLDMSSVLANQTFAITVKLNNNNEYDIAQGTTIGTSVANTAPTFIYELYNADALSDNLQTRYVIVTLRSDEGAILKHKININTEIAGVTEVEPAIVAGKNYAALSDIQTRCNNNRRLIIYSTVYSRIYARTIQHAKINVFRCLTNRNNNSINQY